MKLLSFLTLFVSVFSISICAMNKDTRKASPEQLALFSLLLPSEPSSTPVSPRSPISPRLNISQDFNVSPKKTIDNKRLIEKANKFFIKRQKKLVSLTQVKIKAKKKISIILNEEKPIPDFPPDAPYLIDEQLTFNPDNPEGFDSVRKMVANPLFDQKYESLLGMNKAQRIHSGDYGLTEKLGLFEDLKTSLLIKYSLTPEQNNLLVSLFHIYRDSYRTTTKEDLKAGKLIEEQGKLTRGAEPVLLLFKKNGCERLLRPLEATEPVKVVSSPTLSPRQELKKTRHIRERSRSLLDIKKPILISLSPQPSALTTERTSMDLLRPTNTPTNKKKITNHVRERSNSVL